MTFSYSDLVLGLCVNADTVDKAEQGDWGSKGDGTLHGQLHGPFAVETLAQFDFRVRPTNYVFCVKSSDLSLYDLDAIQRWYNGHNLLRDVQRYDYLVRGLHCKPYSATLDNEPVTRFPHQQIEDDASLLVLRRHGINLQPVWVDGDGSCLAHAVSTSLTGSQLYYDALRFAIYAELRDHMGHYTTLGTVTHEFRQRFQQRLKNGAQAARAMGLEVRAASMEEAFKEMVEFNNANATLRWSREAYEDALEKARPSEGEILREDHYLEEIHIAAISNVLRRPIMVLSEGMQGGMFLPTRHDPEACRLPDGRAAPPVVMYQDLEHYIPLVVQRPEDYWAWAHTLLQGDTAALDALRGYEKLRGGEFHRLPEWVEEIVLYACAEAADRLEKLLDLYSVDYNDRHDYRRAFGDPAKMAELPLIVVLQEELFETSSTIKEIPEMNAVFECLDLVPKKHGGLTLSLHLHKLSFKKMQCVLWALYCLMDMHHDLVPTQEPTGVLPIAENEDQKVWKFVLNFVQKDEINVGLARLYCDAKGWDFSSMSLDSRDPRAFLSGELSRLKDRFHRLTGQGFDQLLQEDVSNQGPHNMAADIRKHLPKALLAIQRVIRERPYPGRGPRCPAEILLQDLPLPCPSPFPDRPLSPPSPSTMDLCMDDKQLGDGGFPEGHTQEGPPQDDGGQGTQTVALTQVPLDTLDKRRTLLAHLVSRYGLPQNLLFESACLSVLLFERFPDSRCRAALADWVMSTAQEGHHSNVCVEGRAKVIKKVVLHPLAAPVPLPSLPLLFPPSSPRICTISPRTRSCSPPPGYVMVPRPPPADDKTLLDPPIYNLLRRSTSVGNKGSPSVSRLRSTPTITSAGGGAATTLAKEGDPSFSLTATSGSI